MQPSDSYVQHSKADRRRLSDAYQGLTREFSHLVLELRDVRAIASALCSHTDYVRPSEPADAKRYDDTITGLANVLVNHLNIYLKAADEGCRRADELNIARIHGLKPAAPAVANKRVRRSRKAVSR